MKDNNFKILQLDKNNYIGSNTVSLHLNDFWKRFRPGEDIPIYYIKYGKNEDWTIDLISKFSLSDGNLTKILLKINCIKNLEVKNLDGEYIYLFHSGGLFSKAKASIHKIPSIKGDKNFKNYEKFLKFIKDYKLKNSKIHNKIYPNSKFQYAIEIFGLERKTLDLIGHACAFYTNNDFLEEKSITIIEKIQLYIDSCKSGVSPFIYYIGGLGKLS